MDCIKHRWEIVSTAIDNLVFFAEPIDIVIWHSAEFSQKLSVEFTLDLVDKGSQTFIG